MVEEEISNALLTQPSPPPPSPPPPQHRSSKNLFDYTEEELYCSHTNSNNSTHSSSSNSNNNNNKSTKSKGVLFNHYELLQIPIHATSLDIKKSYRKLSLQYHPDKTGRDENDYGTLVVVDVFVCVCGCVLSHVIFESIYSCLSHSHILSFTHSLSLSHIYIYTTIYYYDYCKRRQSFWPSNMRTIP